MKIINNITLRFILLFVSLFILTVPFGYYFIPDIGRYTAPYFEGIIKWTGVHIFHITKPFTEKIISDSTGMYIHLFILAVIALSGSMIWSLRDDRFFYIGKTKYLLHAATGYYLSLQLFKYGFDKIFKCQFYLPEPNTLFTPIGYLSRDILYWSAIGSSYYYSVFAGMLEILPAVLLLFKRTRIIGAIISLVVMINVVMVNFGFDISVKIYSCFLLLLCSIVAAPGIKKLYNVFILDKPVDSNEWKSGNLSEKKRLLYAIISV